jgi:enterochelin esterase family protein
LPGATATPIPATATAEPTATERPEPGSVAGFAAFLEEAEASRPADRQPLVNRYTAELEAPLVEETTAIFIWRGEAQSVVVVGDMTNWDPEAGLPLTRLEGTDLWYLENEFPAEARLDYKFVVDGQEWRLDPLNPRTMVGGFGPNSELVMGGYEAPAELQPPAGAIPAGSVTRHTLDSAVLGQTRTFHVYSPPGQLIGEALPSVYFHDGGDYLNLIDTPAILDRLIASRAIPPLIAVFIPPVNRELEYNRNDAYVTFLADELAPFVRATYGVDGDPAKTGTAGASMGGLIAVHAALSRPDTFGLALAQSGAYSLDGDAVIERVLMGEDGPARFYLVVGSYETAIGGDSLVGDLLGANRRLRQALQQRFYDVAYQELPQGHSWGLWQATLGDGLRFLYGEPR